MQLNKNRKYLHISNIADSAVSYLAQHPTHTTRARVLNTTCWELTEIEARTKLGLRKNNGTSMSSERLFRGQSDNENQLEKGPLDKDRHQHAT